MSIAILKYNAGNIHSVESALKQLGVEPVLTDNAEELRRADKVLFPGQGEASHAMTYLRQHKLDELICSLRQPLLGICIGQQLLCSHSEEGGETPCLGIFNAPVLRFRPQKHEQKVPHMGWNSLHDAKGALMQGIEEGDFVYFVHSYYVPLCQHTIATTDYIQPFSAALNKDNFYATQFHPEKSGDIGHKILKNFLEL